MTREDAARGQEDLTFHQTLEGGFREATGPSQTAPTQGGGWTHI